MLQNLFRRGGKTNEPDATRFSILIVSDDTQTRMHVCDILSTKGYRCEATASVPEALQSISQHRPDLMIGDFVDPEADGKSFLKNVGIRLGRTAIPPVVFLMDTKEDEVTARDVGADDLVTKPVDTEALTQCVAKVLAKHQIPSV